MFEDISLLRPTLMITVPRILNRVYGKIMEEVARKSAFAKWMFKNGIKSKTTELQNKGDFKHSLYDGLVFKKVKDKFGGRMKTLITGSAPISAEILDFFKIALSIHIYEIYG